MRDLKIAGDNIEGSVVQWLEHQVKIKEILDQVPIWTKLVR